ncbi:MAG: hypothetical protein ACJA01_000674 [Saprospiraceae bacterium]|jgi:membrane protein implicated in regulation of membrane protease activity
MLSTTELFVEHIISGILSLIWVGAIAFSVTGIDPSLMPFIKDFWGLFALVTTAIAYPIGIFVDTIADKILERWNGRIKVKNEVQNESIILLLHKLKDDNLTAYFTYNRFKTRVSRSSALNFLLIGITVPMFILLQGNALGVEHPLRIALTIFITFILLSVIAILLWREIAYSVHRRTKQVVDSNRGAGFKNVPVMVPPMK